MAIPKYVQISDALLKRIREGVLVPGEKLPTREELTAEFACTRTTIEKALGELKKLHAIKALRKSGTFISDTIPPPRIGIICSLRVQKEAFIAATPQFGTTEAMFSSIVIHGKGLDIRFVEQEEALSNMSRLHDFDILVAVLPHKGVMDGLKTIPKRSIIINRYGPDMEYVSTNHRAASAEIMGRLIDRAGPNAQLLYLGANYSDFVTRERFNGFLEACEKKRMFYRTCDLTGDFNRNMQVLRELSPNTTRPLVTFSPYNVITGVALTWAREKGLVHGQNFFCADFDTIDSMHKYGMQISTVLQGYDAMGNILMEKIKGSSTTTIREFAPHTIVWGDGVA